MSKLRLKLLLFGTLAFLAACGKTDDSRFNADANERIIGGDKVSAGEAVGSSTVAILNPAARSLCSGTLIQPTVVLTAAHCVPDEKAKMVVTFGTKAKGEESGIPRAVVSARRHQQYNADSAFDMYDVALLRLESPAPEGHRPAPLLEDGSVLQEGTELRVAGFGLSWSWGLRLGAGTLRTTTLKIKFSDFAATEFMVDQSLRRGVCSGDSGGPAYLERNGRLYLAGVVSRGDSLPIPLTPDCFIMSIMTRVDVMADWMAKTIPEL